MGPGGKLAWMDSDDEKEAAKLSGKASGPAPSRSIQLTPSHWFPFKAVLRANFSVLQRVFPMVFLRKPFFSTIIALRQP